MEGKGQVNVYIWDGIDSQHEELPCGGEVTVIAKDIVTARLIAQMALGDPEPTSSRVRNGIDTAPPARVLELAKYDTVQEVFLHPYCCCEAY